MQTPENVPIDLRLHLAKEAGYELDAIFDHLSGQVKRMVSAETHPEETVIFALLDRAKIVTQLVINAGHVSEDHAHDAEEMRAVMRMGDDSEAE